MIRRPEVGELVHVRSRQWVVNSLKVSTLPTAALKPDFSGPQNLVSMSSVEDDGLGEELQVIWEVEPGARVIEKVAMPEPTGFDVPEKLDAFLDAVRWGASSTADVKNIQAPFRSGIEIEDYQLDPVVRAIQMPRVNLLIADDVGLGKTIEAGMVALELMLRHRARRILIVVPSSLQIQWRDQMRDKFGLEFHIVDSSLMKDLRRSRGIHANPWSHFPRLITSIDFLKRERPLRLFRETLPAAGESIYPRKYDLLIVDEAHNCAPSGRGNYATDSLRTQALRVLTPHFEHKLFLTATPHNGYSESFRALLALLDNQRFSIAGDPDRKQLEAIMVRRLKTDPSFATKWDGTPRFAPRVLDPIEVPYTDAERELHAALKEYTKLRSERATSQAERFATEFVLKTLKKRLFSCPAAFLTTLEQHERSLASARRKSIEKPSVKYLQREFERIEEDYADDSEFDEATSEALSTATKLFADPTERERALLKQMKTLAEAGKAQRDSKAKQLIAWLKEHLKPKGKWTNERVIIFTEYRATQNWLQEVLATEGFSGDDRLLTMFGGMDPEKREAVKAAFQTSPELSKVRILLATDSASEGLDLQNFCSKLIHYEIPWNPNRMEQRNGRVDRHGQKADKVMVYHFVGQGWTKGGSNDVKGASDLSGDLEFLMRVALKIETIREDLGKVGPVLAQQVEEAMLGHRSTLNLDDAEKAAQPIRRMLKFERDLRKQVKELMDQYLETRRELNLSPDNIQKVVQIALELAGQPGLIPAKTEDGRPCFRLPALRGSWAACAEGLQHPHTQEIRPISFDDQVTRNHDDVVLVHLNHRLPQMCLRLLRAEVWADKSRSKLQRVTARVIGNNIIESPATVAFARLVVIGGDSVRLHEEIITAGGAIQHGKWSGRLPEARLNDALSAMTDDMPSQKVQDTLLAIYSQLTGQLAQSLEARMKERKAAIYRTLSARAEKEAKDITAILTELKAAIEKELNDPEYRQLELFSDPEKEQFERNKDALRARVKEIPEEIEREVESIKSRFAEPQVRLFPVAVTFLVPQRLAVEK
jgi:superfamily II DNA or RNA helicase